MKNLIIITILSVIAIACFILSYLQFNKKGYLVHNSYIYASKQERETMDKRPYFIQSGVIFLLLGIVFLINVVDVVIQTDWLFYCAIAVVVVIIIYAIISFVIIEKKKK